MAHPRIELLHKSFGTGVSEAFMVLASDGRSYAVKFVEKVQNGRLGQARELIAGTIGEELGAPVPRAAILELTQELIDVERELKFDDGSRPAAGLAVGMGYLPPMTEPPTERTARLSIVPPGDVVAVVALNTWLAVVDRHWNNYAFHWDAFSTVRLATLDFADSLARDPAADLAVSDPNELTSIAAKHDTLVSTEASKIEAYSDAAIDAAIATVPDDWLDTSQRTHITELLKSGRGKLRKTLEALTP